MTTPDSQRTRIPEQEAPPERGLGLWRQRAARATDRVRTLPGIRTGLDANDVYNQAGGGLLESGLAFSALFAVIPGLLLVVSLLVVIVDDSASRARVIDWIVEQVPPLRDVATTVVTNLASDARIGSLLGLLLFLWGASGFYLGLHNAIGRTIPGGQPANPILARIQAVAAVALLVFAALVGFVVAGMASVMSLGAWAPFLSPLAAIGVATGLCLVLYLFLPNDRPTVREAGMPALLAGIGIGLLTAFFGALAPLLVQGFVALGVIASVFVALVWFNWTFQILLIGASYVRLRRDGRSPGPVTTPS
ncbi:MAG: YihY/virulence factor BrkB family protein [Chloroflexi bacterium]|nr:YihY/virulence factor BrkB family protein [Chloroflexota bacterium]